MRRLFFLVSAVALASALPACLHAFSISSADGWFEDGDGLLFWLTWASDLGGRRLLLAAGLALGLVVVAMRSNSIGALGNPFAAVVDIFSKPLVVTALVAFALLPKLMVSAQRPDSSDKPDVLFILLDTVRLDHVGWGGSELNTTPKLDALARKGAAFTQGITQAPWTKPAIATLITGQVPGSHGATARRAVLSGRKRTLAEAFAAAGYRTAAYSSNPNITPVFGFAQGFQSYTTDTKSAAEPFMTAGDAWLQEAGEQASFLYLHLNDAHYPYEPLPGYAGMFNHTRIPAHLDGDSERKFRDSEGSGFSAEEVESLRLSYAEEVRYLDDQVGDFVAKQLAANDNLLVVICSDHGEEFLEHGDLGHAHSLHEELIRVPLQFAWSPALGARLGFKPGIHDEQVRHIDVLPTLLEAAGMDWPGSAQELQGSSLQEFFRKENSSESRPAFSETDSMGSPLSGPTGPLRSLRMPNQKLIVTDPWFEASANRYWLYDLIADSGEHKNLALERAALREQMWAHLLELGLMVERSHIPDVHVVLSDKEKDDLSEMGYAEDGPEDPFAEEPYFDPRATKWVEIKDQ
ncbi:MAG: sulfatase [Planctomycetota bacterium]|nr:sulfatase [Planctomycetota bacterium]MDA1113380.1 sulfatase [Planctomycetota bacterium]